MPSTFGIAPLIPGLINEVALEIFLHFVAVDWDGPFTLVLVCTAWRDMVLGSNFLQSLRRSRRGRNPAPKKTREKAGKGICIVSFDGGGPGSLSQLRILDELMLRLAFKPGVKVDDLRPADYFDLMGGVGFGGLAALLLGRLRMTTSQAMEELAAIGTAAFPTEDDMVTREVNMDRLRNAIESMLERHGHSVDIQLHDSSKNRCKVVLFAATTAIMDHCHPFRTYLACRKPRQCTFVDAACATIAIPEYFSSVDIGPRLRKQSFAGIPHGFDNPTREVLKESQLVFGETSTVSLVLSLGSGQRARLSDLDHHVTRLSRIHCDSVARDLYHQLHGIGEYVRLNVDNGLEKVELDDWSKLGLIEDHTEVYLGMNPITKYIDKACQWLQNRNGSVTLGQLTGTKADCVVKHHSERLEDYLKMRIKQIDDVIQQVDIERITLIDAVGRPIRIPIEFCLTYTMLLDMINLYFKYKKAPGNDFVERGDYRLVHGDRRNTMGEMEWTRIDKTGLKVEMSMILRTRNQNSERCPSCRTPFDGRAIDGWAQCPSCSTQFQIETQVQVELQVRSEDTTQSEDDLVTELVTPEVRESEGSQPPTRERPSGGEAVHPQFRLISVINSIAVPFSHPGNQTFAELSPAPTEDYLNLIKASTKIVRPFMTQNRTLLRYCREAVKLYNAVAPDQRGDKEVGIRQALAAALEAMKAAAATSPNNNWEVDPIEKGQVDTDYTKAKEKLKESLTAHGKPDRVTQLDSDWSTASQMDESRLKMLEGRCKLPKATKTRDDDEINVTVTFAGGGPDVVKVHPSTTVGALIWRQNNKNPANTFTEAKVKGKPVPHENKVSDLEKTGAGIALELVNAIETS